MELANKFNEGNGIEGLLKARQSRALLMLISMNQTHNM